MWTRVIKTLLRLYAARNSGLTEKSVGVDSLPLSSEKRERKKESEGERERNRKKESEKEREREKEKIKRNGREIEEIRRRYRKEKGRKEREIQNGPEREYGGWGEGESEREKARSLDLSTGRLCNYFFVPVPLEWRKRASCTLYCTLPATVIARKTGSVSIAPGPHWMAASLSGAIQHRRVLHWLHCFVNSSFFL